MIILMKIERIDDKTVKCFLSNEELEELDIDYKDFVVRSDKAREVVQQIIANAQEEVGYKPPKFAFDMQIMMLPKQGLVLTFSEHDPLDTNDAGQFINYLKEMKKALDTTISNISEDGAVEGDGKKPQQVFFSFPDMGSVIQLARAIPRSLRIRTALYEMAGTYYLYLEKGTASYGRYSKACIQAMEFGKIYSAEEDTILYIREHGNCLIAEHALRKLQF